MEILSLVDYLFLFSLVSIWAILLINIVLAISGYIYYLRNLNFKDLSPSTQRRKSNWKNSRVTFIFRLSHRQNGTYSY